MLYKRIKVSINSMLSSNKINNTTEMIEQYIQLMIPFTITNLDYISYDLIYETSYSFIYQFQQDKTSIENKTQKYNKIKKWLIQIEIPDRGGRTFMEDGTIMPKLMKRLQPNKRKKHYRKKSNKKKIKK